MNEIGAHPVPLKFCLKLLKQYYVICTNQTTQVTGGYPQLHK